MKEAINTRELRSKHDENSNHLEYPDGNRKLGELHECRVWSRLRVDFFAITLSRFLKTSSIWVLEDFDRKERGLPSWTVMYSPFGVCLERGDRGWYRTPWEALLGIEVVLDLALQKINDGR